MSDNDRKKTQVAVLGGTGKEGSGLAFRWAHAGYSVIIGSRTQEKADRVTGELNDLLGAEIIRGMTNEVAAQETDVAVLTVPYQAHKATLESVREHVQGKILVDVTVPLQPPKVAEVFLPKGRSAAEEAQAILGQNVRVVSAFQNISSAHLKALDYVVDCDVLICGDDSDAKQQVIALAEAAGMRGIDAGPLSNAIVAESLTPLLLGINKRYKVKGAGIRITGVD